MRMNNMMRVGIFLAICVLMGLFFMNVYQGYRYERLDAEVTQYEKQQKDIYEDNKQVVDTLSVLESPEMVKKVADKMGLHSASPDQTIIIDTRSHVGSDENRKE
ncbi:MAG: hypothetical protein MJ215_03450 [Spirochaetia bacterium]|nr:hypothetical protein [Spirochaetia bacterium]